MPLKESVGPSSLLPVNRVLYLDGLFHYIPVYVT